MLPQVIPHGRGNRYEEEVAREVPGRVTNSPQLSGQPRSLDSQFEAQDNIATQQPVSVPEPEVVEEVVPVAAREVPIQAPGEPAAPAAVEEVSPVQGVETQGPRLSSTPAFGKPFSLLEKAAAVVTAAGKVALSVVHTYVLTAAAQSDCMSYHSQAAACMQQVIILVHSWLALAFSRHLCSYHQPN